MSDSINETPGGAVERHARYYQRRTNELEDERKQLLAKIAALETTLATREAESRDEAALFEAMWEADMRGIRVWQAAHPDKEKVWPDRSKLVTWLLDELDAAQAEADDRRQHALEMGER